MKTVQHKKQVLWLSVIFILSLVLDVGTKKIAAKNMRVGQSISVIPNFFNFTLVHNTGAAFGMGAQSSRPLFLGVSLIAFLVLCGVFYKMHYKSMLSKVGAVLIVSGAIGNLLDRFLQGYVIDFFDFYVGSFHWHVFNVADTTISIGAGLFILEMILDRKNKPKSV